MDEHLDEDMEALDEVVALMAGLALASMGSAEVAVFVLLSAARRVQDESGEPEETFADLYALLQRR